MKPLRLLRLLPFFALAAASPAAAQTMSAQALSGFQSAEIRIQAPRADGTPCTIPEQQLRDAVARSIAAGGPPVGTSALTLLLRVTTLHDTIGNRCTSALELTALTTQKVVLQATRNELVADIPLWHQTTIAASDASSHLDRISAQLGQLGQRFVADWRSAH